MATVFWDPDGTVLTAYLEHGSTITGTSYTDLIGKVQAALKKRQGKLRRGVLLDQHDTPTHVISKTGCHRNARFKLLKVPDADFKLLRDLSYILDLAPSNLYLFQELKEFVKGYRFADYKDAICTANGCLKEQQFFNNSFATVSYTHLTLPTKRIV